MEAVAAAASVAGIITVVGQSIDGLIKFSDFFSDISSASKIISRLLNDINSLIQVLENIGNVLERARARKRDQNFALLDIKLTDCAKDVQVWLATARLLRPASDSGGKSWIRKFRLAVNNTAIQTIRDEIGKHKQTLCLSLAVFGRTIDIETSDQVHQIGGRFSEALTTSLSVHGAHEEALRRIEHYSITSMHSSAHSVKSMDSIRTELSRLEAMITRASNAQSPATETRELPERPSSGCNEQRISAAAEAEDRGSHLSIPSTQPNNGGESSTTRDASIEFTSKNIDPNEAQERFNSSNKSHRTGEMAVEPRIETDDHIPSAEYLLFMDEANEIKAPSTAGPTGLENKSSYLYAQFSKKSEPRQHESPTTEIDGAAIHETMRQSLASIYPGEIVKYVYLRQVTTLCEDHIDLLDRRPGIQSLATGKLKDTNYVDQSTPFSARPAMVKLRGRLIELRKAIKVSQQQCVHSGYSLSELDKLLSPPGSGSYAPARRLPRMSVVESGDDSSSIYSEDFHSPAE